MYCHYIGFCALTPDEQAAWVQAIGTIAAVLIAMTVPAIQVVLDRKRKREEKRAAAAVAAILILPDVRGWLFGVDAVIEDIEDRLRNSGRLPTAVFAIGPLTPEDADREHFDSLSDLSGVGAQLAAHLLIAMDINDESLDLNGAIANRVDWEPEVIHRCEALVANIRRLKLDLEKSVQSLREIALKGST